MNNLNFQETFPAKFASIVPEKVSKHTFVFRACPLCCFASVVSGVTEISLASDGDVDHRGHRASVKRRYPIRFETLVDRRKVLEVAMAVHE
jgi:hypothetical protein